MRDAAASAVALDPALGEAWLAKYSAAMGHPRFAVQYERITMRVDELRNAFLADPDISEDSLP
jgi:hypothetical protein